MFQIFAWAMLTLVFIIILLFFYASSFEIELKDLEMSEDDV